LEGGVGFAGRLKKKREGLENGKSDWERKGGKRIHDDFFPRQSKEENYSFVIAPRERGVITSLKKRRKKML